MGADLNNIVKCQKLTDDHVQFLIYQILRGLKVGELLTKHIFSTQGQLMGLIPQFCFDSVKMRKILCFPSP